MNKKVFYYKQDLSTQRFALRGTNRGVHSHFHAG